MPETLLDVFERIRRDGDWDAVPVRPDPGDVRARAGRARTRRRLAAATTVVCLLGVGGVAALAWPGGGTSVQLVPASPTRAVTSTRAESATPAPRFTRPAITVPYGPYKDLTPPGALLDSADLGVGQPGVRWTVVPSTLPDQVDSVGFPVCIGSGTSNDGFDGLGHERDFRASVPGGQLFVAETVLRLDPEHAAKAAQVVRDLAPCTKPTTREVVLSRSAGWLLTGTRLAGSGALVNVTAFRLQNDQLIVVTVNGDPTDQVPVPGGVSWVKAVTDRAAARATG